MKTPFSIGLILLSSLTSAQIGVKAGINFANITKTSSLNSSSRSGYHAGIVYATFPDHILGAQTELLFSRQGYNFKTNTNTGKVNLDYLILPQYFSINITRYFSVLFGGQLAYLINANVDSTTNSTTPAPNTDIAEYFKKIDYGLGGGAELHPLGGLILGARINVSLGNLFKDLGDPTSPTPTSFLPKINAKNNLFQIYAGWKFGGPMKNRVSQ